MTAFPNAVFAWLDRHPSRYWWCSGLWLVCLFVFGFLLGLNDLGFMDKTEALFVEVARQMVVTGDWITPHWNGDVFFDYPVWGYWMVALSFKVFGFQPWAARLPSALAAMAVVTASFFLLRFGGLTFGEKQVSDHRAWGRSWLGATMVAFNPGWLGWGRMAVTDMYLSSAIALALLAFFRGYGQWEKPKQQQLAFIATAFFTAIAFLAKGPIGILLPGLVIFAFLIYVKQWRAVVLKETPWLTMLLVFGAIAGPWYGLVTWMTGGEFASAFFGFSNFERFTTVLYRHAGPWYFYLPWCFILLLPWSLFLPLAFVRLQFWRRRAWATSHRQEQLSLFCGFWFVVILLFFSSAATKLAGYILPLVPGGALLISLLAAALITTKKEESKVNHWLFLASLGCNALLLALMAIAAYISPTLVDGDPATPDFKQLLEASGLPVIFSLILGAMAVLTVVILCQPSWRINWWLPNVLGYLLTLILVIPFLGPIMDSQIQAPSRAVATATGELIQSGEEILVMGYPRYSVVYYSQHPAVFADNPDLVGDLLADSKSTDMNKTILVVGERHILDGFDLPSADYEVLAEKFPYQLRRVPIQKLEK